MLCVRSHKEKIIHGKHFVGNQNKADRPANSRERWAGALMEVFASCDIRTDRRTDGRTDKPAYRVACLRLKKVIWGE